MLVASAAAGAKQVANAYAVPPDDPVAQTGRFGLTAAHCAPVVHGNQHQATKSAMQRPWPPPQLVPVALPVQSSEQKGASPSSPPTQKSLVQSPLVLHDWPNWPTP